MVLFVATLVTLVVTPVPIHATPTMTVLVEEDVNPTVRVRPVSAKTNRVLILTVVKFVMAPGHAKHARVVRALTITVQMAQVMPVLMAVTVVFCITVLLVAIKITATAPIPLTV